MCGICGIVYHGNEPLHSLVQSMNELQRRRGPDDQGIIDVITQGFRCTLGHTRLAIIDRAGGAQPMAVENEAVLAFNGEIYNHQSLRRELETAGTVFRTRSDTEVVLHGYRVWGIEGLLKRIDGMFAFAIVDRCNDQVVLARDPAGQKPLYYSQVKDNSFFAFASTLKALASLPWFDRQIDRTALELYLNLRVIPAPYSIYRNTFKLPPGSYMIYDGCTTAIKEFWSPSAVPICRDDHTENELLGEYRSVLRSTLQETLIADSPVSLLLSSGIDSTSLARELGCLPERDDVTAYTMGFQSGEFDESKSAALVARSAGLRHEILNFDDTSLEEELETLGNILDEPFGDPSILPSLRLCRAVAEKTRVAITGDGADELFGGYPTFSILRFWPLLNRMSFFLKPLGKFGQHLLPGSEQPYSLAMKLQRLSNGFGQSDSMAFASWLCIFSPTEAAALLGQRESDVFQSFVSSQLGGDRIDPVTMMCHSYFRLFLPGVLEKMDRASMNYSLEIRTPFLQRRMLEFAFSLPPQFKVRHGVTKFIMRKSLSDDNYRHIASAPKKGFLPPLGTLFLGKRVSEITKFMTDACDTLGIDRHRILAMLQDHRTGRCNYSAQLWQILVLALFLRNSRTVR